MGVFTNLNLKPSSKFEGVRLEGLAPDSVYSGKLTGGFIVRQYDGYDLPHIEAVIDNDHADVNSRWLKLSLSNSNFEFFDKYEANQLTGCTVVFRTKRWKEFIYIDEIEVEAPKATIATTTSGSSLLSSLKK